MSYFVCHAQKFKSSDVRGMEIHNNRESSNSSNKDIDYSRTELNFDAITGEESNPKINYRERVEKILETEYKSTNADGSKRVIRENAVKMVSVMVSSDYEFFKDMPQERVKEYFRVAADELAKKFGRENVVAAKVHMDEKTPHMHFTFVPIKNGKLTAKEIITRSTLRSLQDELPKVLQKAGFDVQRGIENSPNEHIPMQRFKRETKIFENEVKKVLDDLSTAQKEARSIKVDTTLGLGGKEGIWLPTDVCNRLYNLAYSVPTLLEKNRSLERLAAPALDEKVTKLEANVKYLEREVEKHKSEKDKLIYQVVTARGQGIAEGKAEYQSLYEEAHSKYIEAERRIERIKTSLDVAVKSLGADNVKRFKEKYNSTLKELRERDNARMRNRSNEGMER